MNKTYNDVGWDVLNKKAEENYNLGEELYEETLLSKRTELKGKRKNLVDEIIIGCYPELQSIASRFVNGKPFKMLKSTYYYNSLKQRNFIVKEDVINVGAENLINRLMKNKYNPSKGTLSTYIESHLPFLINDYFKDKIFQTIRLPHYMLSKGNNIISCVNFCDLQLDISEGDEPPDNDKFLHQKVNSESLQDSFFEEFENKQCVDFLLNRLSPKQREVLERIYLGDRTLKSVGKELGKSSTMVDKLLKKGEEELRRKFMYRKSDFI